VEVISYPHVLDLLQPEAFFPNRHGYPERSLAVFKAIPVHPGSAAGKLHGIQNNQDITEMGLVKQTGERRKIRSVGR